MLIPTLSAIIPIQRALSKTLSESLDTARSTLSGSVVIIESKAARTVPFLVFGLLTVTAGVTIYIVLPQALLAENAGLVLQIFFLILVGLILGLTLLAANLVSFVERIVTYVFLCCESKSMRALVKKNLVAHKHTNKLTSIIYALTLGCVIFLCVALNLVLKSTAAESDASLEPTKQSYDLALNAYGCVTVTKMDAVLKANKVIIRDFGYLAVPI